MAEDDQTGEKEFDASQQKLARAREQGDFARSEDAQSAVALAGFLLALALAGSWAVLQTGTVGSRFLDLAPQLDATQAWRLSFAMAAPGMALLLLPAGLVLVYLIATRSLVFAAPKLEFRLSRISPLASFKQKFGTQGLVDFAKKAIKMTAIGTLLTLFLQAHVADLLTSPFLSPGQIAGLSGQRIISFLVLLVALWAVFGAVDWLWQRHHFLQGQRMTRKDMTDEMKESEGDPHLKADRQRRAREVATNRMLLDVPKADVVIVNPTHYAVALKWDRKAGRAPRCVAKGVDEVAARIRALAQESGVPLRSDPPTARALFAALEIGQEVRPEHYAAVAAAIRFADAMKKRARRSVVR